MISNTSPLWVVTSYFNPAGYRRRLANFQAFRRNLNAPLLVVELAAEGKHQLNDESGDCVVRLTGDSHIWQKERLLNIAIALLPHHVKYVAWVDCDVAFEKNDWAERAARHLENHGGLLQLFKTVMHCPEDFDPNGDESYLSLCERKIYSEISAASVAVRGNYKIQDNIFSRENFGLISSDESVISESPGHAWAARVSEVREVGIYDANIIGGGDSILFHCAVDALDSLFERRYYSKPHRNHIATWKIAAEAVGIFRKIGFLDGKLFHFWHGSFSDRLYRHRHKIPFNANFDPSQDLRLSENGAWEWNNPECDLARQLREYFIFRREDGPQ